MTRVVGFNTERREVDSAELGGPGAHLGQPQTQHQPAPSQRQPLGASISLATAWTGTGVARDLSNISTLDSAGLWALSHL